MAKQVEQDPQQYIEDWFNVAIPMGKEFELPNLSNMSTISTPDSSFQSLYIHTNPPLTEIDVASNTEIEYVPFPRVVVATKPTGAIEGQQSYSSSLSANPSMVNPHSLALRNQQFELPNLSNMSTISTPDSSFQSLYIHTNPPLTEIDVASNAEIEYVPFPRVVVATKPTGAIEGQQSYSSSLSANPSMVNPHSLALRNQQSIPRLIPTPRVTSLNPPFFYSMQTIHVKYQQTQFSGVLKYASPCYSDSVVTFKTDRNAQGLANHLAGSNVGSSMIMSNYQQNPSILTNRIEQPILVANLDSLNQTNLNVPKYLSLSLGLMSASLSFKAQEIQIPNAHNLKPKEELLDGTSLSSHFNSPVRRRARSLSIGQTSCDHKNKCFICKASFTNGKSLGGHMSSHAKKRKIEALRSGQFFESGTASKFGDSSTGSQDGSDKSIITSADHS